MNKQSSITPRETIAPCCENCRGDGRVEAVHRIHGEGIDSDYVEVDCPECGGTGEGDWTPGKPKPAKSLADITAAADEARRRINAVFGKERIARDMNSAVIL